MTDPTAVPREKSWAEHSAEIMASLDDGWRDRFEAFHRALHAGRIEEAADRYYALERERFANVAPDVLAEHRRGTVTTLRTLIAAWGDLLPRIEDV